MPKSRVKFPSLNNSNDELKLETSDSITESASANANRALATDRNAGILRMVRKNRTIIAAAKSGVASGSKSLSSIRVSLPMS